MSNQPHSSEPHPPPGLSALAGDYELGAELGRGGTAVVYLARERATDRAVAIKVVRAKHLADEEAIARCMREARVAASLKHPNIVALTSVRDLGDDGIALIMDYVPGRTLKQRLRAEGPLRPTEVERVLRDVAAALGHAHVHGIVHRDVKPENIFLEQVAGEAQWRRALLSDFGIARAIDEVGPHLTMTGTAIGTPSYMAPEQIDGGHVDGRSDLYSLGLAAWEMRSGRAPWQGESLFAVLLHQKHDLPRPPFAELCPPDASHLALAVDGLLAKAPEHRWQDTGELIAALDGAPPPRRLPRASAPDSETLRFLRPTLGQAAPPHESGREHEIAREVVVEWTMPTPRARPEAPRMFDRAIVSDIVSEAPPAAPRRRWTSRMGRLGIAALVALLAGGIVFGTAASGMGPFGKMLLGDGAARITPQANAATIAPSIPLSSGASARSRPAPTPFEIAHPARLVGSWSHYSLRARFADSLSMTLRADGTLHAKEARFVVGRNGWRPGVTTHDGTWEVRAGRFWGRTLCTRWPADSRGRVAESCTDLVLPSDSSEPIQFGGRYWRRVPTASPPLRAP